MYRKGNIVTVRMDGRDLPENYVCSYGTSNLADNARLVFIRYLENGDLLLAFIKPSCPLKPKYSIMAETNKGLIVIDCRHFFVFPADYTVLDSSEWLMDAYEIIGQIYDKHSEFVTADANRKQKEREADRQQREIERKKSKNKPFDKKIYITRNLPPYSGGGCSSK